MPPWTGVRGVASSALYCPHADPRIVLPSDPRPHRLYPGMPAGRRQSFQSTGQPAPAADGRTVQPARAHTPEFTGDTSTRTGLLIAGWLIENPRKPPSGVADQWT